MSSVARDLRFAVRQLHKTRGFTLTAVLTLALGIGASSATFCLMDGLWLHPMPVSHSDRLTRIFATTPGSQDGFFSYPEYQALAGRATAFHGFSAGVVAMGGRGSLMPNADGTSTLLLNNVVSANFFSVLGVHPMLGRVFTAADSDRLRSHPGLVLGYRCWQRTFGGDPNIVGRQIPLRHGKDRINQVDIWGVLPPDFRDVDPNSDRDLWIPAETLAATVDPGELTSTTSRWFNLIGRLAPGATVAEANDQVATITQALAAADPANSRGRSARVV
ncbi:MAG: ABC transporter permease, partial [Terracidiphilus sp.]